MAIQIIKINDTNNKDLNCSQIIFPIPINVFSAKIDDLIRSFNQLLPFFLRKFIQKCYPMTLKL